MKNEYFIDTELNTDGVKKGAEEINETMEEVAEESTKAADTLENSFNKAVNNAKSTVKDFVDGVKEGFSEGFNEAINTEGAIDLTGTDQQFENTATQAMGLRDRIVSALDELSLKFYQSGTRNGEMMGNTINTLAGMVESTQGIVGKAFAGIGKGALLALKGVGKLTIEFTKLHIAAAKALGGAIVNGFARIGKAALKTALNVVTLGRATKKTNSGFGGGLKSLLRYGLGISSLFILFNKLRSGVVDGMKNLAKFDAGTNASISGVTSALTTLKNSLATAFAPILTVIAPIITGFINQLSAMANAIGAVLAKLTGKSTFSKAIAVQNDYKKSLDKTGKSAKNSSLSIDEFNQSVDDSQSSAGGGDAGAMFEETQIDDKTSSFADRLKAMWADADFTDLGGIFAKKIAQGLDSIEWGSIQNTAGKVGKSIATFLNGFIEFPEIGYKVGNAIAQGLNTALETTYQFVKNFHWDSLGKFIADGINGLFLNFNWEKLGETFALSWNGIWDTIATTFANIEWESIGSKMGDGVMSMLETIDFSGITRSLGELIKAGFDWTTGFLTAVDWQNLPRLIKDKFVSAITAVDWAGIGKAISKFLGAAIASVTEFFVGIGQVILEIVISIKNFFKRYIDEYIATSGDDNLGKAIVMGILNGIIDGIKGIGSWIYNNLFVPFIEGFKAAFEIHSPSHVMYEMGGFIIAGLLSGLGNIWEKVKDKFIALKTNVTKTFKLMKDEVIEIFGALKQGLKTPINGILGCVEQLCNGIIKGINKAIEALNSLSIDVPDWVPFIGGGKFNMNIPTLNTVSLPRLATGTVVPRQAGEFAAILGDNNREAEVVSPLSTIQAAVANVIVDEIRPLIVDILNNTDKIADKDLMVAIGDKDIARANRRGEKLLGIQLAH